MWLIQILLQMHSITNKVSCFEILNAIHYMKVYFKRNYRRKNEQLFQIVSTLRNIKHV